MNWLETKVPPPILTVALGALAGWLVHLFPQTCFAFPLHAWIAVAIGATGLFFNVAPKRHFRRAGTAVNPMHPANTTTLVESGLHRYSRNPMYVGHALLLLAWAIFLQNGIALVAPLAYAIYITRFQIAPEERSLRTIFGDAYLAYCKRVRRWL